MKINLVSVFLFLAILFTGHSQTLSEVDFVLGADYTGATLWENYVGISIYYDDIKDLMNNTNYQGYILNSNVKGKWANNFVVSLKTPLGHKYNCTALAANVTNPNVTCTFETQGNTTYWEILGEFVWNNLNQPNWCITYDMQGVNLTLASHREVFYNWLFQVYKSTYYVLFCNEMVDYGDKMVERGYKTSYTPADFLKDIEKANNVAWNIAHSGPGITDQASSDWLLSLEKFAQLSFMGHFTVRCVVFPDPTTITIEKILSDNATKYYLRDRFKINETYSYSNFETLWLGITDIKLTTGDGVDGITNTFAATLWAVDIALEFILMKGFQINFNHQIRNGNFQAVLGTDLKPTAIYYGLLFTIFIRDGSPDVILPTTRALISSKIKVYGFSNGMTFKIVLLNKDTNTSLNGKVLVKSEITNTLKCIYMEAPSLDSKDNITIGGYHFIGGNASAQGSFVQKKVQYNFGAEGFQIPIKYAQAVMCETDDSKYIWPLGKKKFGFNLFSSLSLLGLILLMALFF